MTGEITLRGTVLPVGGIREKALAAHTYGIKKIILPYDNQKDLDEIPSTLRQELKFFPVKHVSEVLSLAYKDKIGKSAKAVKKAPVRKKKKANGEDLEKAVNSKI